MFTSNSFLTRFNPKWLEKADLYKLNQVAFKGEWTIKNSSVLTDILMPTDTMSDPKNPKKEYLYQRYKQSALYVNYPQKWLNQALGLVNKGEATTKLPKSMSKLVDYATLQNLSLSQIFNEILSNTIQYGGALLVTRIPDDLEIAKQTPKIQIIPACDVLDSGHVYNKDLGLDMFTRVIYYKAEYLFNYDTNTYNKRQIFIYIKALDKDGTYYQAKLKEQNYQRFNLLQPEKSRDLCQSLSYPKWFNTLDFVPAVYINYRNLKQQWLQSPIQPLIDISLAAFQLNADIRFLEHQQSSSTLVIAGTDIEGKSIRTGVGNVINLTQQGSNANYVSPSVAGLGAMQATLSEYHTKAKEFLLDLTEAGKNASGQAIYLRITDKTSQLLGIVKVIGLGIQRQLEYIGMIMNEDIDQIEYQPYTDFADYSLYNDMINQNKENNTIVADKPNQQENTENIEEVENPSVQTVKTI